MLQNEFPTVPDRDEDSGDPSDLLSDHFEHHLSSDKYNCVTVSVIYLGIPLYPKSLW